MENAIGWFEIPTTDIARATAFYEKVMDVKLASETFMGTPHAMFPFARDKGVGGTLIFDPKRKPGSSGSVLYLTVANLDACLARVKQAGGEITVASTTIPSGVYAVLRDTEGNEVGLYAKKS